MRFHSSPEQAPPFDLFFNHHRHRDRFERIVVLVPRNRRDLVDHVHAAEDLSEDTVGTIQPAVVSQTNEKLRAVVVEIARAGAVSWRLGHGDGSSFVRVVAQLRVQPVTGTAGSVFEPVWFLAQRITSLNDEAGDDPVKGRAIIELHLHQVDEVLDVTRCGFRIKPKFDFAELGGDGDTWVDFLEFHRHGD